MHHRTRLAGEPVQQGRLADVRLADQRHPARAAAAAPNSRAGSRAARRGSRPAGRPTRGRAAPHRVRLAQAQRPQRGGVRLGRSSSTLLAASSTGRSPRRSTRAMASSVAVAPTLASTTTSTASAVLHRPLRLRGDRGLQPRGVGLPAAGVDHGEPAAPPQRVVGDPVAGDARDVLHDGLAAPDDPVHQRRLADVRPADDGERRVLRAAPPRRRSPSVDETVLRAELAGVDPQPCLYATSSCSLTVAPYLVEFDDQPGQRGPDGLGGGGQPGPAAAGGTVERLADQHVHPRPEPPPRAAAGVPRTRPAPPSRRPRAPARPLRDARRRRYPRRGCPRGTPRFPPPRSS